MEVLSGGQCSPVRNFSSVIDLTEDDEVQAVENSRMNHTSELVEKRAMDVAAMRRKVESERDTLKAGLAKLCSIG